uniref:HMG box domain-containing protein n=1 Tax=Anopheles funestus TaxID=62324 RepID=A0A182RBV9_ANOFN
MIQNSAYGNPILASGWLPPPICLQNQTLDLDSNNNDKNGKFENGGNICYRYAEQCDDHQRDGITPVQEHPTDDDSTKNHFQTSHNVQNKTDDVCIVTSRTSQPVQVSQSNDEPTQKTVETTDNVSTVEQMVQNSDVADVVESSKTQDMDESDYIILRPMNAFLLFCKVHRKIVRKRYKVENRNITKKLGLWWGLLTKEEKLPFQNLSNEHKDKLYAIDPNFQWTKKAKVRAKAPMATRTKDASANTTSTAPEAEPMDVADDTISIESLEAAEALVRLHEGIEVLSLSKLANEADMGKLNELCKETVASQTLESKCNQSSQVSPDTGAPVLDGLADQTEAGPSTQRAPRACKGKRYKDFMSHMLSRAQSKPATISKKSPKAPTKQRKTGKVQTTIANGVTVNKAFIKFTVGELRKELLDQIRYLPVMSIDHFVAIQNAYKQRKKAQESSAPEHQSDVPADVVVECNTVESAPIGTIAQPTADDATASEAPEMVRPTPTKLVGSSKRKSPKERITHHPQSATVERQTILICHMPEANNGVCHGRAGQHDNPMTFQ